MTVALLLILLHSSPLMTVDVLKRVKRCQDSTCRFETKLGLNFQIDGVGTTQPTLVVRAADDRAGLYLATDASGCIVVRPGGPVSMGDAAVLPKTAEIFDTLTMCRTAATGEGDAGR